MLFPNTPVYDILPMPIVYNNFLVISASSSIEAIAQSSPLSSLQLLNKIVFLVSFVGNQGTFTRGYKPVVMDMPFLYHVGYVIVCMLGLFVHEFFYSFLVSRNNLSVWSSLQHFTIKLKKDQA